MTKPPTDPLMDEGEEEARFPKAGFAVFLVICVILGAICLFTPQNHGKPNTFSSESNGTYSRYNPTGLGFG